MTKRATGGPILVRAVQRSARLGGALVNGIAQARGRTETCGAPRLPV